MSNNIEICRSCGNQIHENFCPNCGQKRFKRINGRYIIDEFKSIFIASNKGFFYTIKRLLKNPGKTAREYINGHRQKHYKPILLALLLATITTFVSYQLLDMESYMKNFNEDLYGSGLKDNPFDTNFMANYMAILKNYNNLIMIGLIPFYALASYWSFKKYGDNYYEHIIANAFFQCLYSVITIFFLPFYFIGNIKLVMVISSALMLTIPLQYVWFMRGFYPEKNLDPILKRVSFTFILIVSLFVIILIVCIVLAVLYIKLINPELIEQFKAKG